MGQYAPGTRTPIANMMEKWLSIGELANKLSVKEIYLISAVVQALNQKKNTRPRTLVLPLGDVIVQLHLQTLDINPVRRFEMWSQSPPHPSLAEIKAPLALQDIRTIIVAKRGKLPTAQVTVHPLLSGYKIRSPRGI
jgi:hypothetical protein